MSEIDLEALREEMTGDLNRYNIHVLREQGHRLGVKSVTTHPKARLVSLIIEKKLMAHKPYSVDYVPQKVAKISLADRQWLMELAENPDQAEGEMVSGVLELDPEVDGYLRVDDLKQSHNDIYVPQGLINASELRYGDSIVGKAVRFQSSELRGLIQICCINGAKGSKIERPDFLELSCIVPDQIIPFASQKVDEQGIDSQENALSQPQDAPKSKQETNNSQQDAQTSTSREECEKMQKTLKMMDIFAPMAKGQRRLVAVDSVCDITELIISSVEALLASRIKTTVLCLSEKPEMVCRLKRRFGKNVISTPIDFSLENNQRLTQLTMEQLKRKAEMGGDVALVITNMSILMGKENRQVVEREFNFRSLFATARKLEGGGSLTILAYNYLIGRQGEYIYETLVPLANSVVVLGASEYSLRCPSLNIYDSRSDYSGQEKVQRELMEYIEQKEGAVDEDEIIGMFDAITGEQAI